MGGAGRCGSAQARRPADAEAKVSLSQTNGRRRQVRFRAGKAAGGCGSEGFAEPDQWGGAGGCGFVQARRHHSGNPDL